MFGEKSQDPVGSRSPQANVVQVSPVPLDQMKPQEPSTKSTSSMPQTDDAHLPGPQPQVPVDRVPSWEQVDTRDPEDVLELPVSQCPREVVDPSDVVEVESLELPEGELPMPIEGEGLPFPSQVQPEASEPVPRMRRYNLPSAGTAVHVVPSVPFRRAVWIISRGAGGLQAAYARNFSTPDLIDVQVNGIPIPLFAGQDLFMCVINAAPGDDLEISLIIEPRGNSR